MIISIGQSSVKADLYLVLKKTQLLLKKHLCIWFSFSKFWKKSLQFEQVEKNFVFQL